MLKLWARVGLVTIFAAACCQCKEQKSSCGPGFYILQQLSFGSLMR